MLENINIDGVYEACRLVDLRTINAKGYAHGRTFFYDQCMRAFDCKALPAEAITFSVYLNAPIMAAGEATIHRDGSFEMRTV